MIRKEAVMAVLGSPVAYYAAFAQALGGVEAGVFASQFFYWHGKGHDPDGWVYKTQAEIEEETGLTRRNQETARKRLRDCGVLEEKYTGMPAKLYYRLNIDVLFELMNQRFISEVLGEDVSGGDGDQGASTLENTADQGGNSQDARTRHPRMRESAIQGCANPPSKDVQIRHPRMRESANHACANPPDMDGGMRHTNTKTTTETTSESTTETTTTTDTSTDARASTGEAAESVAVSVDVAVPDWLLEEFEYLLGDERTANAADRTALAELAALPEHVIAQALDAAQAWLADEKKGPIHSLARWLLGTARRKLEAEEARGASATKAPPVVSPYSLEALEALTGYDSPGLRRALAKETDPEADPEAEPETNAGEGAAAHDAGVEQADAAGADVAAPADLWSDFWRGVLFDLEQSVPRQTYDLWMRNMRLLSCEGDVYVIGLGDARSKEWMENRFTHTLKLLLSSRVGRAVSVRFEMPPA
jgi:hypothetical protein